MSLGENIRRLRRVTGLRQSALAELAGIRQSQLSDWESDRFAVLDMASLIKLAMVLHCSVDYLLVGVDPDYDRVSGGGAVGGSPAEVRSAIAVIAEGDAVPDGLTPDAHLHARPRVLEWLPRPAGLDDPRAYGVQIRGTSMQPAYRPRTTATVSPAQKVQNGDEVYVQLAGGECLVRQAHEVCGGYILEAYDRSCPARFAEHGEIKAMHVIVYSCRQD